MMKKRVIGIVGPTASGKTALSLPAAQKLNAEIICMDSMQVYTGMDIGTAKPTRQEQALVPHHMLDILPPDAAYSVSQYAADARQWIEKSKVPLLVGGTGLYLQALSLPMGWGEVGGDEEIRKKYHALADTQGNEALHAVLMEKDPLSAQRLHPNDVRRVVRALEVFDLTGKPISAQVMPTTQDAPYDFQLYAIDMPRDMLYRRVDERVDAMMKAGLLEEVRSLSASDVPGDAQSMQGLGYKELLPVLDGTESLENAIFQIKLRTRHYAKRQLTWFKRDERIRWLSWRKDMDAYVALICENYYK